MNHYLFHVYHEENNSWKSTLQIQRKEIPGMSRILAEIVQDNPGERFIDNARHLQKRLEEQETVIDSLTHKIDEQQHKLEDEVQEVQVRFSSLDTLFEQEELRDTVLKFEKNFLDFKQNFHHYLLTLI